jgi:hypothetical protein
MASSRYFQLNFWDDETIQELTPTAKLLLIYFYLNIKTTEAGIIKISDRAIKLETGIEETGGDISELQDNDLLTKDHSTYFIHGFPKYNPSTGLNHKKSILKALDACDSDKIFLKFHSIYSEFLVKSLISIIKSKKNCNDVNETNDLDIIDFIKFKYPRIVKKLPSLINSIFLEIWEFRKYDNLGDDYSLDNYNNIDKEGDLTPCKGFRSISKSISKSISNIKERGVGERKENETIKELYEIWGAKPKGCFEETREEFLKNVDISNKRDLEDIVLAAKQYLKSRMVRDGFTFKLENFIKQWRSHIPIKICDICNDSGYIEVVKKGTPPEQVYLNRELVFGCCCGKGAGEETFNGLMKKYRVIKKEELK